MSEAIPFPQRSKEYLLGFEAGRLNVLAAMPVTEIAAPPTQNNDEPESIATMDIEAFFNIRDWVTKALETAGAARTGGGIGMGQADIDISLEGFFYNISIRPI